VSKAIIMKFYQENSLVNRKITNFNNFRQEIFVNKYIKKRGEILNF